MPMGTLMIDMEELLAMIRLDLCCVGFFGHNRFGVNSVHGREHICMEMTNRI